MSDAPAPDESTTNKPQGDVVEGDKIVEAPEPDDTDDDSGDDSGDND